MSTQNDPMAERASAARFALPPLLRAMRPHHWLKNALVFVPILLSHSIFDPRNLLYGLIAAISLSFAASAIYLMNDIIDVEADRRHPTKRLRPLAAGEISEAQARAAVPCLLAASFGVTWFLPKPLTFLLALCAYLVIAMVYLFWLKRKLLMDVMSLAALHTLRILAGNAATMIALSHWLLAFAVFVFFSLALVKRYAELLLALDGTGLRSMGRGYQAGDLEALSQLGIASGCISALILALYVDSAAVKQLYQSPQLIWLICPIVLYTMARIWVLARRGQMLDDPLVFMIRDWRTQLMGVTVVGVMLAAATLDVM